MGKKKCDAVHRFFTYDKFTEYSKCNICGSRVKGQHSTNLKAHVASKHNSAYVKVVTMNNNLAAIRQSQKELMALEKPPPPPKPKPDFLTIKLKILCMKLIVVHGRPLSLLSDEPFREILRMATNLAENTTDINQNSVLDLIPDTANQIKVKIATEIRDKLVSLKIDSMTYKRRKFIGINIQYINNDKIIVRNLAIVEISEYNSDESVKERIIDILNDFLKPSKQIYSLVTDNGSNNKRSMNVIEDSFYSNGLLEMQTEIDADYLEDDEEEESEEPDGSAYSDLLLLQNTFNNRDQKVRGTLCPTRTLQLAIKDSITENVNVQVNIDIARNITRVLRSSPNKNLLRMAEFKMPKLDKASRWTTTYEMLVGLQPLKDFCNTIHDVTRLISVEFWDEIDQIITCLKPFYDCTQLLKNEQLTIGDFYINWMNCKATISSIHHPLASSLRQSMERREKTLLESDLALEGLYLDGRLNVVLSQEQCEKAKALLTQTRERLQKEVNSLDDDDSNSDLPLIEIKMEPEASTSADFTALEELLRESEKARGLQQHPVTSFAASLQELQCRSRLPLTTNILEHYNDPLITSRYGELAAVARTVFATPVTQASTERMFSSLKFILNPLRENIGNSLLEEIVFIRANVDLLD